MAATKVDKPRQPSRARGHTRFEAFLNSAEVLLRDRDAVAISLQDVAKHANAPLASVYHYFPSNAALFLELARRYLAAFGAMYDVDLTPGPGGGWPELCRRYSDRSRRYYEEHPTTMRLLLGPDFGWRIRESDLESNLRIGRRQLEAVRRHFDVPDSPHLVEKFALSITISDSIWSLSYLRHGHITPAMAEEASSAKEAYLALHLPVRAPRAAATDEPER